MAYLILVRHGTSEWNKLGKWTGLTDVDLASEGIEDARRMGEALRDIDIHKAHVSKLKRAHQTLHEIKKTLNRHDLEANVHAALNERDYGIHTGKDKWQVRDELGEKAFHDIRRGWDTVILNGENLKDVHGRVIPYYEQHIHPQLLAGHNVLVVAHGNSLRALVKHLDNIADDKVHELEIGFGEVYCYKIDADGKVTHKEIRATNPEKLRI
ncbi:2,3-bisphosphoglycerate-dependent phosphoglycerate mutase [Candidatus Kaiserbacteria bacterium]|nr:2,3-bisphosphoglycerate-dependent phosphoglycerate mutase [Candidatus Kaiserbacteria bacterium]